MEKLTFTNQGNFISNIFNGGVALQFTFSKNALFVVFLESRLEASLPWSSEGRTIRQNGILNVPEGAEGQEFRVRCGIEPVDVSVSPLYDSNGKKPGANSVGTTEIEDGGVHLEDLAPEVRDKIIGDDITEDDLENVFFEPKVNGITTETTGENVVVIADADNVDDDEEVTWHFDMDGVKIDIDGVGTTLELTTSQSAAFNDATSVIVSLSCSDYDSEPFTIKITAEAGAGEGEVEGEGANLDD